LDILLIEPFFGGSHAAWARGLQAHSAHRIELLTLPDRSWKWRMHGAALTLAREFLAGDSAPDLILASDMLDLTTFLALTRERTAGIPTVLYFHENQLAYPWSPNDPDTAKGRDRHYGFINLASALAADGVWFNSAHNRDSFLAGCRDLLGRMRDFQELERVDELADRAKVIPLGLDLGAFDRHRPEAGRDGPPLILWNHRWEHDKNPEAFFGALFELAERGLAFEVAILGQRFRSYPAIFDEACERLGERIVQFGHADAFADYAAWLWAADLLPVTSYHDFFGISVAEAAYCATRPLLPRRLAYPELIPESMAEACFYPGEDALADTMASALSASTPDLSPLRTAFADYDWARMAPRYDRAMEGLIS
jgi:glycosyltransferase involved in cell wall biosynthesis